jgi:hypothetical protein
MYEGQIKREQMLEANFSKAFEDLQKIAAILTEMGLRVRNYISDPNIIKEDWKRGTTVPVAADGCDGIRASRNEENNGFVISFTNGFEDYNNPQRQEVTTRLKEAGFDVN